jgi:hypothetical protein
VTGNHPLRGRLQRRGTLADLRLIPAHDGNPVLIPKPTGIQAHLLDLLDVDISRPRWLTQ